MSAAGLGRIDHIVVLMLENRSYDHILGFLYTGDDNRTCTGAKVDGLTGSESNPDSNGNPVSVFRISPDGQHPYFMPAADPGEGYYPTNAQLFGTYQPEPGAIPSMQGFVRDFATTLRLESAKGSGAVVFPGTTEQDIMGMFTPELLPVISTLAKSYAVSDRWFASVPTETFPNRAFLHMATSQGQMNDDSSNFTARCIYEQLGNNATWAIYGYDQLPLVASSIQYLKNLGPVPNIGVYSDFAAAAANGTLANYIFLEPSWDDDSSSEHPVYDVAAGERFIAQVYETLRTSPQWSSTLFILLFDEHGGCYDHVPPPYGAEPPDDLAGEYGFDFRRFGVRVPAVLVSPWIARGTVLRPPDGGPPFDHTSVLKTIENRWNVPPLTRRDAAAPDVSAALTLSEPRTDDALAGVTPPQSAPLANAIVTRPPAHLQLAIARAAARLPIPGDPVQHAHDLPKFATGNEAIAFARERQQQSLASTLHRSPAPPIIRPPKRGE